MDMLYLIQSVIAFLLGFLSILWTPSDIRSEISSRFATKTAYRHCGLQSYPDDARDRIKKQCNLVHINALFRHGTRSPSSGDVIKFENLFKRLINSEDAVLPEGFIDHPIPFKDHANKQLLPMGFKELYDLGQQFRKRANCAFAFNMSNIRFVSSSSQRALDSGRSFYHGFFNLPPLSHSRSEDECVLSSSNSTSPCVATRKERIEIADHLLRFFDYCDKYREDIEKNKSTVAEYTAFYEGPEVLELFEHVMLKYKLNKTNFKPADLYTLYVGCAFELAAYPDTVPLSPWCQFFDKDHFPILEFLVDLKQYWRKSYGYELNYLQSCPLVGEMLGQLRDVAHQYNSLLTGRLSSGFHRATFWFGHAETVLPVAAAFGLFNDSVGQRERQTLQAKGYHEWLRKSRSNPVPPTMFRSGHIAPFAGNIALFLYHCPHVSSGIDVADDPFAEFYVQPEVNDHTLAWPVAGPVQPPTVDKPGATSAPLSLVLQQFHSCMPGVFDDDKVCKLKQLLSHLRADAG